MNQPNLLGIFYKDEHTRNAVKEFMINMLEDMVIKKVFNNEPVTGIYEAKALVEKSFNKLEEIYEPPQKKVVESSR